jgi:ATP-binding cassette subfamily A (ABC1) protein 3
MRQIFSNLFGDPLNLGALWASMLFWSFVYLLLSWYFEQVFPGEYGIKMPFYFPFMVN